MDVFSDQVNNISPGRNCWDIGRLQDQINRILVRNEANTWPPASKTQNRRSFQVSDSSSQRGSTEKSIGGDRSIEQSNQNIARDLNELVKTCSDL
jgi:hypothetical protein